MGHPRILNRNSAALLIIDFQEAFRKAIPDFGTIAARISALAKGFVILGRPIFVTEQYPSGLGHTAEEVMFSIPDETLIIEKTRFGAGREAALLDALASGGIKQLVICGIEAHICVNQSTHDFLDAGFDVHLLIDCVSSRFDTDRRVGIEKMLESGAVSATVESALFEMLGDSRSPHFKQIQALIK